MSLATDTARAKRVLTKLLDAHTKTKGGAPIPAAPTYLHPPTRTDMELVLSVIGQLEEANEQLRHQAMLPAWVNGDPMAMAAEMPNVKAAFDKLREQFGHLFDNWQPDE